MQFKGELYNLKTTAMIYRQLSTCNRKRDFFFQKSEMGHTSIVLTRKLQKGAMRKGQQKLHQVAVQECCYCDSISRDTHA